MQSFTSQDYHAFVQNWSVVQDTHGIIYVGTNDGVNVCDGASWRMITMPNASIVRSVNVDGNGRIYVGAVNEFGYLAPDSKGTMGYISLLQHIKEQERSFGSVRNVVVTSDEVFFRTNVYLFRLSTTSLPLATRQGQVHSWRAQSGFTGAFVVKNQLYVQQDSIGLMTLAGDSLRLVPDGEKFRTMRVYFMLERDRNGRDILLGTRDGLFIFDGTSFHLFQTDADAFLRANRLQHGTNLTGGLIAIATERGGAIIMDSEGRVRQILDKAAGLRDVHVKFAYQDREGGLWLALNNGIARYEIQSPFTLFQRIPGIENGVVSIVRHHDVLYAATGLGVYYLRTATNAGGSAVFKPVAGITSQCRPLLSANGFLFACASDGLYEIIGDRSKLITKGSVDCLYRPPRDANRVYVGFTDGLGVLQVHAEGYKFLGRFPGITEQSRYIAEDESGTLWIGMTVQGVLRVQNPLLGSEKLKRGMRIQRYGAPNGLPHGWTSVYAGSIR